MFIDTLTRRLRLVFRDGSETEVGAGATPAAHADSHQLDGDDAVATTVAAAGAIPAANTLGYLDVGWGIEARRGRLTWMAVATASGTAYNTLGCPSLTGTGTASSVVDETGAWVRRTTNSANTACGHVAGGLFVRLDQVGSRCAWLVRTPEVDTNIRFFVGLTAGATWGNSTTLNNHSITWRYDTNAGDTGLTIATRDGSSQTISPTVAAFPTNAAVLFELWLTAGSVLGRVTIDGVTYELEVTATLPGATTPMRWDVRVWTLTAQSIFVDFGTATGDTGGI